MLKKYLGIIPLTVIPDGNVKYGAYSKYNYYKGKKYYTPKIIKLEEKIENEIKLK